MPVVRIQMAVIRDGVQFQRVERASYIPFGLEGEPDALSNYMAVSWCDYSE